MAAKLRENLKRRKEQARARTAATGGKPQSVKDAPDGDGAGAPLKPGADSDS